jgi:endonuclease YncB( thermonuclease family)
MNQITGFIIQVEKKMKLRILLTVLMLLLATAAYAKEPIRVFDAVVTKVSDGDTLVVYDNGTKAKIRLYGIDAPETPKVSKKFGIVMKSGQPYGEEAFRSLEQKVSKKKVRLEVIDLDRRYNRLVALIKLDGRNINKEMVDEGWAWAYRQYLHRPYSSEFISSEENARAARKGLWVQNNPQPPWEFRKSLRKGNKPVY